MINAEVTARTGASDATGAGKSLAAKQGKDGEKSGFSDALSTAGGSRQRDESKTETDGAARDTAAESGEETVSPKGRSALDLTASVLFDKSANPGRASTSVKDVFGEKPAAGEKKTAVIDVDDVSAALANPKNSKAEATGSKNTKAETAEKTTSKADEKLADADDAAVQTTEAGLSDVLSLLAGGAGADLVTNASPRQTGSVRERGETRGEKTVGSATEGRSAQASAAAKASDALDMSSDSDAALVDERTFRLSSGRGTGQSLDMKIGTDEQGNVGFEAKAAGNGNAENVVVLDSRRFLGFGQSANGAALTAAMSDDKTWAAAMTSGASLGDPLASSTGNVVNTLKLQLNPHDLGSVTATLRLTGETLNVHLTVENHAAYRQLNDDSSGMIEALRSQGFSVDQVTISVASTSQSDTSSQQQQGQQSGQASAQQQAANDGRQGNGAGAGRGQDQPNQQSTTGESARGTNEPVSDTVAAGNARPEQLYL
ncbi:flagellar hook-length control protein FliK [Rhizobium panacihumi]|uniref:flagellar hook-length control protein FliK n=1 Tax=Rhizobium panacihumi TaxID=2008450 RepID=UPI003D78F83E